MGFEAYGKSLEELFRNCALAIFVTTADLKKIDAKEKKEVKLQADNVERLLYDFLSETLYLRDVNSMIFKDCSLKISKEGGFSLKATLTGEKINPKKHELRRDIKAVTMHLFEVKQVVGRSGKQWKAKVVLDV